MNIEEKIRDCEYNLKQINHFNPDPYYVSHFFRAYLQGVIDVYNGIFEEADRDFGLFVSGRCIKENFERKAKDKNDQLALNFLSWFNENYKNDHDGPYPNFIKKIIYFFKENNYLPNISIKVLANQRFKGDMVQEIKVGLHKGKLKSKEDLEIEIKRQLPAFLEIINQKRKSKGEPRVSKNQVIASSFLEKNGFEDIEISQACEVYLPVMKRFLDDSREKIKQLTNWS